MIDLKVCPDEKILNKKTKRCVLKTGKIGKKILNKVNSSTKSSLIKKDCPDNKIYNTESKRCVLKSGKVGLAILNENKDIKLKYDNNNSCFVDSILVAFFHFKNKEIYNIFFNKKVINSFDNKELKKIGNNIQKELYNLYLIINNTDSESSKKVCSFFRKLLDEYYNIYITINKNYKTLFGENNNWKNKQLDIFDLLKFLSIIFNFENSKEVKILDGKNLYYSNFIIEIPSNYLFGEIKLDITEFIPLKVEKYNLDDGNKFKNSQGQLVSYYEKKTEILKSPSFIFIEIFRNAGSDEKLKTIIDFPMKIKLKENTKILEIKSLVIHYGPTVNSGHYICLIRRNNKWFEYDDLNGLTLIKSDKKTWDNYKKNIVGLVYSY